MRCGNCGHDNPNTVRRCERCNSAIVDTPRVGVVPVTLKQKAHFKADLSSESESEAIRKETKRGCPRCGYPLRAGDTRCPSCEFSLSTEKKSNRTVINTDTRKTVGLLFSYSINPQGVCFPIYEGRNTIGRASDSDVVLSGDEKISDKHFIVRYLAGKFEFRDELSSNGTRINGELKDEGELNNTDVITVGNTKLIFFAIPEKF
jgi:hypothetical protein